MKNTPEGLNQILPTFTQFRALLFEIKTTRHITNSGKMTMGPR